MNKNIIYLLATIIALVVVAMMMTPKEMPNIPEKAVTGAALPQNGLVPNSDPSKMPAQAAAPKPADAAASAPAEIAAPAPASENIVPPAVLPLRQRMRSLRVRSQALPPLRQTLACHLPVQPLRRQLLLLPMQAVRMMCLWALKLQVNLLQVLRRLLPLHLLLRHLLLLHLLLLHLLPLRRRQLLHR